MLCLHLQEITEFCHDCTYVLVTVHIIVQALGKLCGGNDDWPGALALVHSYLTHKAGNLYNTTVLICLLLMHVLVTVYSYCVCT